MIANVMAPARGNQSRTMPAARASAAVRAFHRNPGAADPLQSVTASPSAPLANNSRPKPTPIAAVATTGRTTASAPSAIVATPRMMNQVRELRSVAKSAVAMTTFPQAGAQPGDLVPRQFTALWVGQGTRCRQTAAERMQISAQSVYTRKPVVRACCRGGYGT